jgi:hypothetical protein
MTEKFSSLKLEQKLYMLSNLGSASYDRISAVLNVSLVKGEESSIKVKWVTEAWHSKNSCQN